MTAVVKSAVGKKEGRFVGEKKEEKEVKKGREEEHPRMARLQAWLSRTMTIPFYFSHSLVSLTQTFDFYLSCRPCHFFNPWSSPLISRGSYLQTPRSLPVHRDVLNVFHDRAIHSYCSASSIEFQFFEALVIIYSR